MAKQGSAATAEAAPFEGGQLRTVAEVADHMRVSNMTVYRLIKAGELPAIRVGKNFRVRTADLQAYLLGASTVAAGEPDDLESRETA